MSLYGYCSKCSQSYELEIGFSKNKAMKSGYSNWCKGCMSTIQKERYRYAGVPLPPAKAIPAFKVCSTCKVNKPGSEMGRNRRRKDGLDSRCKLCLRDKDKRLRARRRKDPSYKLRCAMSSSIYRSLKNFGSSKKGESCFNYLPYSLNDLKCHLERLFKEGMTWENYGTWHIDHIKPQSAFMFTSMSDNQFQVCWSLVNLCPLWAQENISKSSVYQGRKHFYTKRRR